MADYVHSVAIQANSFQNNMADKTVWRINRGRINEYSLYLAVPSYTRSELMLYSYIVMLL